MNGVQIGAVTTVGLFAPEYIIKCGSDLPYSRGSNHRASVLGNTVYSLDSSISGPMNLDVNVKAFLISSIFLLVSFGEPGFWISVILGLQY